MFWFRVLSFTIIQLLTLTVFADTDHYVPRKVYKNSETIMAAMAYMLGYCHCQVRKLDDIAYIFLNWLKFG